MCGLELCLEFNKSTVTKHYWLVRDLFDIIKV